MEAVKLLARLEGILLDPVYTGKAMAGLIDGITQKRFKDEGPILFVHTGGAPRCLPIILMSKNQVENNNARKYSTGY
jgi:1-aminocyclopropane-1-carboxylate deaminase/D-cysteine desulfhydrase-like pyridoxal-dependent ACC family enzyme